MRIRCSIPSSVASSSSSSRESSASARKPAKVVKGPVFDRQAAASALASVDLHKCKATNVRAGQGHVTITFEPTGAAGKVVVDGGDYKGTPVAKCITAQYKRAQVPAFTGASVSVGKSFKLE